jgi:hypothetical protein
MEMFRFQQLCTDPCDMGLCIIMVKHEVMVADDDLIAVSLCIKIAIQKMQLCPLSIAYAGSRHNPTANMGHSVHNIDISKLFAHTTPNTLSAIWPAQEVFETHIFVVHITPFFQWASRTRIDQITLLPI